MDIEVDIHAPTLKEKGEFCFYSCVSVCLSVHNKKLCHIFLSNY